MRRHLAYGIGTMCGREDEPTTLFGPAVTCATCRRRMRTTRWHQTEPVVLIGYGVLVGLVGGVLLVAWLMGGPR